jgi:hypothetical protein
MLRVLAEKGAQRTFQGLGFGPSKELPKLRSLGVITEYIRGGVRYWGITSKGRERLENQQRGGRIKFMREQAAKVARRRLYVKDHKASIQQWVRGLREE